MLHSLRSDERGVHEPAAPAPTMHELQLTQDPRSASVLLAPPNSYFTFATFISCDIAFLPPRDTNNCYLRLKSYPSPTPPSALYAPDRHLPSDFQPHDNKAAEALQHFAHYELCLPFLSHSSNCPTNAFVVTNMLNKLHGQPDSYDRKFVPAVPRANRHCILRPRS
jgi:hypothetical protein